MSEQQRPEYRGFDSGFKAGEPPAAFTPNTTEQPLAYNPVSGWAVAGCIVGGLFAVLVAVCTLVALLQGVPLFFPLWILVFAVVGGVLSLIGQWHVQTSDGTRVGGKLARIGLWLSLVSGLSYLSYYYVTGLALENQANTFVMEQTDDDSGFFPRLREGADNVTQRNAAFLLTRPPTARGSARPEDDRAMRQFYDVTRADGMPGELTQFREHPLGRILSLDSAKTAEITPLAVQDWVYEQKMYKVSRKYRITTKELSADFRVLVYSSEAEKSGQGRKWFVNLRDSEMLEPTLTDFGKGLRLLRTHVYITFDRWGKDHANSPFKSIASLDGSAWDVLVPDVAQRKARQAQVYQFFTGPDRPAFTFMSRPTDLGRWEEAKGKIRIHHAFRFTLPRDDHSPAGYAVDGYAVFEPVQAVNPENFSETSAPPDWNLVRVVFTGVTLLPDSKKGSK